MGPVEISGVPLLPEQVVTGIDLEMKTPIANEKMENRSKTRIEQYTKNGDALKYIATTLTTGDRQIHCELFWAATPKYASNMYQRRPYARYSYGGWMAEVMLHTARADGRDGC